MTTPTYAELNLIRPKIAPPSADIQPKTQYSEIIPPPNEPSPPVHEMKIVTTTVTPSTFSEGSNI